MRLLYLSLAILVIWTHGTDGEECGAINGNEGVECPREGDPWNAKFCCPLNSGFDKVCCTARELPLESCLKRPTEDELFSSDNFPNSYHSGANRYEENRNIECNNTMVADPGNKVLLNFYYIQIDSAYNGCRGTRLAMLNPNGTEKDIYCGNSYDNFQIVSDSNELTFTFKAEIYSNGKGWLAKWSQVPDDYQEPEDKGVFFATYPTNVRRGRPEQVCVELHSEHEQVDLQMDIYEYNEERGVKENIQFKDRTPSPQLKASIGADESLKCETILLDEDKDYNSAFLRIRINDGSNYNVDQFRKLKILGTETRLIVQTDKGKYKSGDMVKMRFLKLDEDLKNVGGKLDMVKVLDTGKRTIQLWRDLDLSEGIIQLEFELLEESPLGNWQIQVFNEVKFDEDDENTKMAYADHTAYFEVAEYVIPKFEVTVKAPSAVLREEEENTWKVCAVYTHGSPVKGRIEAVFSVRDRNYWSQNRNAQKNVTVEATGEEDCTKVSLSKEDFKALWNENNHQKQLTFEATFIEAGTEETRFTPRSSVTIVDKAIKLRFGSSSREHYLGSFPYTGQIQAVNHDDSPRASERLEVCTRLFTDLAPVQQHFQNAYSFTEDNYLEGLELIEKLQFRKSCQEVVTDEQGMVEFSVPLGGLSADDKVTKLSIKVKAVDLQPSEESGMKTPEEVLDVKLRAPAGQVALSINDKEKAELPCGESRNIPVYISGKLGNTVRVHTAYMSGGVELSTKSELKTIDGDDKSEELSAGRIVLRLDDLPEATEVSINRIDVEVVGQTESYPELKLAVVVVTEDDETLTDSVDVKVGFCLKHKVSTSLSTKKASPGEMISMRVKADKGSLCGVSLVDKSVDLLGNDNKVTKEKIGRIKRQLQDQKTSFYSENYQISVKCPQVDEIVKIFTSSGINVISNLPKFSECQTLEEGEEGDGYIDIRFGSEQAVAFAASPPQPDQDDFEGGAPLEDASFSPEQVSAPVRTNFPESWLFNLTQVDGSKQMDLTVPDTITSWVGEALCLNPQSGFGLAEPEKLTVTKDFFGQLRTPFSVKRGEVFQLNVSVFNNLDVPLPLKLTILSEEVKPERNSFDLCLNSRDNQVVSVPTKAEAVGDLDILVSVEVQNIEDCATVEQGIGYSDRLLRPLRVKPEGIPVEKVDSDLKCLEGEEEDVSLPKMELPDNVVPDSDRGFVHVTGDILAPALQNIGNLVRLPTGCGEQNMVKLAPNIYLLEYLDSSPQSAPELREKALKYMKIGYNRQQKYRHPTGSYSIWGGRGEKEGSTWLTAFVLKVFAQATKYIQIEEKRLLESAKWLLTTQLPDGCFEKRGYVYSSTLQGGNSEGSLSAFVTISLIEAASKASADGKINEDMREISQLIKSPMTCLINRRNDSDLYSLSLTNYALALYKNRFPDMMDPNMEEALTSMSEEIENQANKTLAGVTFWDQSTDKDNNNRRWWYYPRSTSIEITAYNIMSKVLQDKFSDAVGSVKWLGTQRNSQGGFVSTQDTVVALQALSMYGTKVNEVENTAAKVKISPGNNEVEFNNDNKILLKTFKLPQVPAVPQFSMAGSGCILVQSVLRYNTPEVVDQSKFRLVALPQNKKLTVCSTYIGDRETTGMVILEVEMISGYEAVNPDYLVNEIDSGVQRVEVDEKENVVVLYFDELVKDLEQCVDLKTNQKFIVEDVKPARLTVYDYYDPEERKEITYTL